MSSTATQPRTDHLAATITETACPPSTRITSCRLHHLLDLNSREQDLLELLRHAQHFADNMNSKRAIKPSQSENRAKFILRAQHTLTILLRYCRRRLGMTVLNPAMENLSDKKGESSLTPFMLSKPHGSGSHCSSASRQSYAALCRRGTQSIHTNHQCR